ncbi:MAG: hypothetical protein L0Z62_33010 [Gemmataceae bacterium]|nr:hypothetical protein [Gemmataceae bacterium]
MSQKGARPAKPKARSRPPGAEEAVQIAANAYCLTHYGVRCSGGSPRRLSLRGAEEIWIVPVVFTSPGYGAVGDVGVVAVDAATHDVIGATPRAEVRAAVARLAQEKSDALEAAFRQARTV